ncbi:hypothetical protein Ahy_B09g095676 isoform A [Arachis hypogaea]|uniref:Uncharacterized protein n=1 Tax=Arachis hypogaea TaxID=3818 RepID=A0A444XFQ1_ARAHY|nr:hypothetical protein Ahy_B09g095676 isoform A [Arachis hypogaea]
MLHSVLVPFLVHKTCVTAFGTVTQNPWNQQQLKGIFEMGAENEEAPERELNTLPPSNGWKNRILIPTLLAGVAGAGTGFAIVTGCYCGVREFVTETRKTGPDDLWNSVVAGFGTGALLGRLQGGQLGAVRYSVIFAVVGTTIDYATLKAKDFLRDQTKIIHQDHENSQKNGKWFRLPEWSPIRILDEEALAKKRAQEEEFLAQRARIRSLREEES